MPKHKIHREVSKFILGKGYEDVHTTMDLPALFKSKGHRRFLHDPASGIILYGGDPERLKAYMLHVALDRYCTRHPNVKRLLEAMLDAEP